MTKKTKAPTTEVVAAKPAKVVKAAKRHKQRSWLRRNRHTDTLLIGLAVVALLAYSQIILPNSYASKYEGRVSQTSNRMQDCAADLAETTKLPLFAAPDVSLDEKQRSIDSIRTVVKRCNDSLQQFNHESQSLPQLKFSGYTPQYRSAQTIKNHGQDIAGQSSDVLNQYLQLANFLDAYFDQLRPFVEYTTTLNQLADTNMLFDQTDQLAERGNDLHQHAVALRQLKPATGFESIIQPSAIMLDMAANGFDNLAIGYQSDNDSIVNTGFKDVEQAVAEYDKTVKNLPFNGLQASYITKQATGLSVKFNDLKSDVSY